MLAHRNERWTLAHLCVATALLTACASSPQSSARRDLRLDTKTVSRVRHAAAAGEAASSLTPTVARTVASQLAEFAPVLLTLLDSDNAVGELEEQLKECAVLAERQVNTQHFGNRAPTRWISSFPAYAGSNQGALYREALKGEALIISPRVGFRR
jgi:hypothetical protein